MGKVSSSYNITVKIIRCCIKSKIYLQRINITLLQITYDFENQHLKLNYSCELSVKPLWDNIFDNRY